MSTLFIFLLHIFFIIISTSTSTTPPSEISALQAFKSSIKPSSIPPFSCLASWVFTSDPCTVPHINHFTCGLTCTNTRVTQLTLDSVGYSGTLSPLVSQLTQLTHLDLSENNFYGPIPPSLSSLTYLQTLSLRANSFSGSVPASLYTLNSLQSLDLSRNSLSGILSNTVAKLTKLSQLDISYNKLTGSIPKLPPNLVQLALKNNSLSGFLLQSLFTESTRLAMIELSENSFVGVLKPWFFLLPTLQQVNLSKNKLTRVEIWRPVYKNNNLVAVDISFNKLRGNLPVTFTFYPMLTPLALSCNRLRGPIPFGYGKKFKSLFLDGNYLNGSPPVGLFSGEAVVARSLGDNCLQRCPVSSPLCVKSQKPTWTCKHAYGKPRFLVSLCRLFIFIFKVYYYLFDFLLFFNGGMMY